MQQQYDRDFRGWLVVIIFALFTLFILFSHNGLALATGFSVENKERQIINISRSGINRITMLPHRIIQVTGDEGKYKLKIDDDGSNIYIMPLNKIGERIELSIKTSTNFTEDLELITTNEAGKTIYLKRKVADRRASRASERNSQEIIATTEIKQLLFAMQTGDKQGKYYIRTTDRDLVMGGDLKVKQVKSYRYGSYSGAILEVSNQSKREVALNESDFSKLFKNSQAVSFEFGYRKLSAKQQMRVFVVTDLTDVR